MHLTRFGKAAKAYAPSWKQYCAFCVLHQLQSFKRGSAATAFFLEEERLSAEKRGAAPQAMTKASAAVSVFYEAAELPSTCQTLYVMSHARWPRVRTPPNTRLVVSLRKGTL